MTGIAGLTELSFELDPEHRGDGGGTGLVRDVRSASGSDEPVLAAVAPGNAASVRALLSAGFIPVGSVQLFRHAGHHRGSASASSRQEQVGESPPADTGPHNLLSPISKMTPCLRRPGG